MDGCIYRTKDGECDLYAEGGKFHAFCVGDEPCEGRRQTNYDSIISKTPEELATLISESIDCGVCEEMHGFRMCDAVPYKSCEDCWLDWLKQEATG